MTGPVNRREDPPEIAAKFSEPRQREQGLRILRTVGGIVVCFAGCAIALFTVWRNHDSNLTLVLIGLVVALIGAGAVDYTVILSHLLRRERNRRD